MTTADMKTVPVIDLFAGPGGLSEGFVAFQTTDGCQPFEIALSIKKDTYAHQTLTLRSFFRQFAPGIAPEAYYTYLHSPCDDIIWVMRFFVNRGCDVH